MPWFTMKKNVKPPDFVFYLLTLKSTEVGIFVINFQHSEISQRTLNNTMITYMLCNLFPFIGSDQYICIILGIKQLSAVTLVSTKLLKIQTYNQMQLIWEKYIITNLNPFLDFSLIFFYQWKLLEIFYITLRIEF